MNSMIKNNLSAVLEIDRKRVGKSTTIRVFHGFVKSLLSFVQQNNSDLTQSHFFRFVCFDKTET